MLVRIKVTRDHVDLLKRARIFPGVFRDADSYLSAAILGWIKPGINLVFRQSITLEPYSGVYQRGYKASSGQRGSHGLCSIGSGSYSYAALPESMLVGRHCSIASRLQVLDSHHPMDRVTTGHLSWRRNTMLELSYRDNQMDPPARKPFNIKAGKAYPIVEHDVWIGQDVVLALGITIGTGSVIAANSLVTKSVPPYEIWGGNPARKIRDRLPAELKERLLASEWWRYDWRDFSDLQMTDPIAFLAPFEDRKGSLARYEPRPLSLPDDFMQ